MIEKSLIKQKLYERYIEPTKKKRESYIGIEIEMPILNLSKEAVDFKYIHDFTKEFIEKFGFDAQSLDDDGNIISAVNPENGDILSYDCSYNNLELSFGKEKSIGKIDERFILYYSYIEEQFSKKNYTLTGFGINPYRNYNKNEPIPNGRYRMLFHHLSSYNNYLSLPMYFHNNPNFGLFSSASQVQLDVEYEKLPETIEAFSKLEPIKALLFSNSVMNGEDEETLCVRDSFWENSTHGINPHNIGMFECEIESVDDIQAYIESTSIYCVERDGKYINFEPVNILEYFSKDFIKGEFFDGKTYREIKFEPQLSDLEYLRTFKFEDLTFRGTIEFRSGCCQPIKDRMSLAAFHIGLIGNVDELKEILDNDDVIYHHGYNASELRKMFVKRNLPEFVSEDDLYALAKRIVDLSYKGLSEREYGEEDYLKPLYERIEKRTNPGKYLLESIDSGKSLEDVIEEYSVL